MRTKQIVITILLIISVIYSPNIFAEKELRATLEGHEWSAYGVALNGDGTIIASASLDETVRLWDTSTGDELEIFEGHPNGLESVAVSPKKKCPCVW